MERDSFQGVFAQFFRSSRGLGENGDDRSPRAEYLLFLRVADSKMSSMSTGRPRVLKSGAAHPRRASSALVRTSTRNTCARGSKPGITKEDELHWLALSLFRGWGPGRRGS